MAQQSLARRRRGRLSVTVSDMPAVGRVVLIALLVAGFYFVSGRLAFIFSYPGTHALLLWPPSTVLLVAMLFTPRRTWWTFVLAALPAHLFVINPLPTTAYIAVLFYAGNVIESAITVLFIQRFNGGMPRFDDLNNTVIFVIGAVFIAPAIGSACVAALAALVGAQPGFIGIWQARFLSYVLSMIMLVPPALVLIQTRGAGLRSAPAMRYAEAGLIVLGYVCIIVFMLAINPSELQSLSAMLLMSLPLMLWAGARFGVSGVSMSLLLTFMMSAWAASYGRWPFSLSSGTDVVLGLKLLMIELGVPMILMAALLAERRTTILSLTDSNRQVRKLAGQLITAQEEERRHVARELHDQVGQSLSMVKINLDTLRLGNAAPDTKTLDTKTLDTKTLDTKTLDTKTLDTKTLLDEGSALADLALEQVRNLSVLLHPAMLDDLGLEPALRALLNSQIKRIGYDAIFHAKGLQQRLPREIETVCYRVVQEGLTNIAKHAHAKHVWLEVSAQADRLRMTLRDDGVGFDVEAARAAAAAGKSMGMISMTERARLVGGALRIDSAPGQGTTLTLDMPLVPGH